MSVRISNRTRVEQSWKLNAKIRLQNPVSNEDYSERRKFVTARVVPPVRIQRTKDETSDASCCDVDIRRHCSRSGHCCTASALLEEAYRARAIRMVIIGDLFFSELGSDTRYQGLMARLHLPVQR